LRNCQLSGKRLLEGTDLTQANLSGAELAETDLEKVPHPERCQSLEKADLSGANLRDAKLGGAYLHESDLRDADLTGADLSDAKGRFESGARMSGARLDGADLSGADLTNARITEEQLRQAKSLEGATMPNGQKYEEWRKSKGSGEDGENSGPS
jgi:serine/threonine-protein kinase